MKVERKRPMSCLHRGSMYGRVRSGSIENDEKRKMYENGTATNAVRDRSPEEREATDEDDATEIERGDEEEIKARTNMMETV
jgi:hypothetical protein